MRLLVVLALVAFTGCQANVLRSEEPKSQLDVVKDTFWEYFAEASKTAQDTVKTITESELGQQVNAKIKDGVDVARQYAAIAQDQVSTIGQETYNKVSERVDWLSERLQQDFKEVQAQMEPYTEPLRAKIEEQVEKLGQAVAPYTESLEAVMAKILRTRDVLIMGLLGIALDLQEKLSPSTRELQEALEQRLQEFQQSVTPLANSLLTEISQRARQMELTLTPYIDDLEKKLDPYTKDIKAQLNSLWESFTQNAKV